MRIMFDIEHEEDKMTNFKLAEAVFEVCNEACAVELDAEVVARMILLQLNARKGGDNK